jgi:Mg-chelatase subunit ChlD
MASKYNAAKGVAEALTDNYRLRQKVAYTLIQKSPSDLIDSKT